MGFLDRLRGTGKPQPYVLANVTEHVNGDLVVTWRHFGTSKLADSFPNPVRGKTMDRVLTAVLAYIEVVNSTLAVRRIQRELGEQRLEVALDQGLAAMVLFYNDLPVIPKEYRVTESTKSEKTRETAYILGSWPQNPSSVRVHVEQMAGDMPKEVVTHVLALVESLRDSSSGGHYELAVSWLAVISTMLRRQSFPLEGQLDQQKVYEATLENAFEVGAKVIEDRAQNFASQLGIELPDFGR